MHNKKYISNEDIILFPEDVLGKAIALIELNSFSHLPVVKDGFLLGMISSEDITNIEGQQKQVESLLHISEIFFAKCEDTIVDLFSVFANHDANIVPILDNKHQYVGFIDLNSTLSILSETYFLQAEGNILLLKTKAKDYLMSEIAQIVESNQNEIIGSYISYKDDNSIQIVIKIRQDNINQIIQSFRRYEYEILNDLSGDSYLESLKNRSEYFIKYLNL